MDARDYSFDAILRDVEASQKRLGIEQFDVLYIHDPMDIPMEQVMGQNGAFGGVTQTPERGDCWICRCRG